MGNTNLNLLAQGYAAPPWHAAFAPPRHCPTGDQPSDHLRRGSQRFAAHACYERAFEMLFEPTHDDVVCVPSAHFRALLPRKLRLSLPLARPRLRVSAALGCLGRPPGSVPLADMIFDVPIQDARRIEVVCTALPFWHGEQLAVDATIVNPVGRRRAESRPGVAQAHAAQRKRCHTYPEFSQARRWFPELRPVAGGPHGP